MAVFLQIPLWIFLIISGILFAIGFFGLMTKRNGIRILMSIEIILCSANLNLVAFTAYGPLLSTASGTVAGQVLTLISIMIAAAEASIGLAILLILYRNYRTIDISTVDQLGG